MSDLYEVPEQRTEPWPEAQEHEIEALATQFAECLAQKYGIATLAKIDEDNKLLDTNVYDSVYDHIDMTEFFEVYIKACGMIGLDWHNPYYSEALRIVRVDGYVCWGDCYEVSF